jgi:xanthine/uracil permease
MRYNAYFVKTKLQVLSQYFLLTSGIATINFCCVTHLYVLIAIGHIQKA